MKLLDPFKIKEDETYLRNIAQTPYIPIDFEEFDKRVKRLYRNKQILEATSDMVSAATVVYLKFKWPKYF